MTVSSKFIFLLVIYFLFQHIKHSDVLSTGTEEKEAFLLLMGQQKSYSLGILTTTANYKQISFLCYKGIKSSPPAFCINATSSSFLHANSTKHYVQLYPLCYVYNKYIKYFNAHAKDKISECHI